MLLINNIGTLATATGSMPACGAMQNDIVRQYHDVSILIKDGRILRILEKGAPAPESCETVDAANGLVTAGLVDAHTHLVFGGWRQHEVEAKLRGASYIEILKAGGGILNTLVATRNADEDELLLRSEGFLNEMLSQGITTVEIKSGYGLDANNELKQLRVINRLMKNGKYSVVPTFMAAHAIPPEFSGDADGYVNYVCDTILPLVAEEELAEFCDVFCETGVFDAEQSKKVLTMAQIYGIKSKIHADEIEAIGGSQLAGEMGCVSAEHLIAIDDNGIDAMASNGVIACLLPGTSLYLNKPFAPARALIEKGVAVAVCTDFNPGSCPSNNLQLCMNLAYLKYRMTPQEVLTAVTLNAACAIGRAEVCGTVEAGKAADIIVWDAPDIEYLVYRMGSNLAKTVIKNGIVVRVA